MTIEKARCQIAAEEAIQYLLDYERDKESGRMFHVGSVEKPEASVRAIANVTGIIRKWCGPVSDERIMDEYIYRKHLRE